MNLLSKTFLSMLFSLTSPWCVEQKGLNSNERSFVWASGEAFVFFFGPYQLARSPCIVVEFSHFF